MRRIAGQVAIIGAGPAGLAAAVACKEAGASADLFEAGASLSRRQHATASHLTSGVGGAGLFSDGKFSFAPAGAGLLELTNRESLARAREWLESALSGAGIVSTEGLDEGCDRSQGVYMLKPYPTRKSSLSQRRVLINSLEKLGGSDLRCLVRVSALRKENSGYIVDSCDQSFGPYAAVVLATGRFGAIPMMQESFSAPAIPLRPLRHEFGIRVEVPSTALTLPSWPLHDPKLTWARTDGIEVRTFCFCREGEVWHLNYPGVAAVSGRSEAVTTGYFNFGLVARFSGESYATGEGMWPQLLTQTMAQYQPLTRFLGTATSQHSNYDDRPWYPRSHFQPACDGAIPSALQKLLQEAVCALLSIAPDLLHPRTACIYPAIEGTGSYPDVDADLRVYDESIWCAGDITGRFRGLVPSLVSGYYVGIHAAAVASSRTRW